MNRESQPFHGMQYPDCHAWRSSHAKFEDLAAIVAALLLAAVAADAAHRLPTGEADASSSRHDGQHDDAMPRRISRAGKRRDQGREAGGREADEAEDEKPPKRSRPTDKADEKAAEEKPAEDEAGRGARPPTA